MSIPENELDATTYLAEYVLMLFREWVDDGCPSEPDSSEPDDWREEFDKLSSQPWQFGSFGERLDKILGILADRIELLEQQS